MYIYEPNESSSAFEYYLSDDIVDGDTNFWSMHRGGFSVQIIYPLNTYKYSRLICEVIINLLF